MIPLNSFQLVRSFSGSSLDQFPPIKTVTLLISTFEVTELNQLKHEVGPNLAEETPQHLWIHAETSETEQ